MASIPATASPAVRKNVLLESNDYCLLCLQTLLPVASGDNAQQDIAFCGFISRYFGANLLVPSLVQRLAGQPEILEVADVYFQLCDNCRLLGTSVVKMFQELEALQEKLQEAGKNICELIESTGFSDELTECRMNEDVKMVNEVREELKSKCSLATSAQCRSAPLLSSSDEVIPIIINDPDALLGCMVSLCIVFLLACPLTLDNSFNASPSSASNRDDLNNNVRRHLNAMGKRRITKLACSYEKKARVEEPHPLVSGVSSTLQIPPTDEKTCEICCTEFPSRGFLEKHRVVTHNIADYVKCRKCGAMLLSYHHLENHRNSNPQCRVSQNRKRRELIEIARPLFPYEKVIQGHLFCPFENCCEVFNTPLKLNSHLAVHGHFSCGNSTCLEVFTKGHELAVHEFQEHGGIMNRCGVQCPRCRLFGKSQKDYINHFVVSHLKCLF